MRVSSPESIHYGKHWTPKEIKDYFQPSSSTVESVKEWLSDSGLDISEAFLSDSGT